MRTLVLNKQIEPFRIEREKSFISDYEGLLTSEYKQVTKANFFNSKPDSLFGIKQRVKSRYYAYSSPIGAVIKLSLFGIILALVI